MYTSGSFITTSYLSGIDHNMSGNTHVWTIIKSGTKEGRDVTRIRNNCSTMNLVNVQHCITWKISVLFWVVLILDNKYSYLCHTVNSTVPGLLFSFSLSFLMLSSSCLIQFVSPTVGRYHQTMSSLHVVLFSVEGSSFLDDWFLLLIVVWPSSNENVDIKIK